MPKTTQSSPKASYIRDMAIQFTLFIANMFYTWREIKYIITTTIKFSVTTGRHSGQLCMFDLAVYYQMPFLMLDLCLYRNNKNDNTNHYYD